MRVARLFPVLFPLLWLGHAALAMDVERACDAAAARAEREMGIPSGVLAALGTVESSRGGAGGAAAWPWTINAAGQGAHFNNKNDAKAAVLALMTRGYPFIDVGCFQIDILYHAGVFRSLDEAFDPERNAQEAARILSAERARGADWATAVARYHSANPEHGLPYLQRVRAALPASRIRANAADLFLSLAAAANQASLTEAAAVSIPVATWAALPRVIYVLPITTDIEPARRRSTPPNRAGPTRSPASSQR